VTQPDTSTPFLVFGAPRIEEDEIAEVEACLRSGWLGTGPRVAQFEQDFARWRGVQASQVVAVNSCTAALHVGMAGSFLAMNTHRIGKGVHYLSVPEHPYYQQRFGWRPDQWPEAMRLGRQTVSLPLSPAMSDGDVERVIEAVRSVLLA